MSDPVDKRKRRLRNLDDNGLPMNAVTKPISHVPPAEDEYSSEEDFEEDMAGEEEMSGSEEEYEMEYEAMDGEAQQPRAEADMPVRSEAEQPRAEAEAPQRMVAEAEATPPARPSRTSRAERSSRPAPHVSSAKGERMRKTILGLGSDGPTPSIKGPFYKTNTSSASSARPPSRLETPVVNGRAPAPTAKAAAPETSAKGHGFTLERYEYDYGVNPTDDVMFSTTFELGLRATGSDLASSHEVRTITLTREDLRHIFRMSIKNPDRALTDPGAYDEKALDLSQVLLKKLTVRGINQNTTGPLDIQADPSMLKFLNIHYKPGQARHCMLTLGAKAKSVLGGEDGLVILDNSSMLTTKTFKTFGHLNVKRLLGDITYPSHQDVEQRLMIARDSQLAKLIIDNEPRLRQHFPHHEHIIQAGERGHLCPADVIEEALVRYNMSVNPLLKGIIDATNPFKFELLPGIEGNWQAAIEQGGSMDNYRNVKINVQVVIEVEYCFPKSALNKYALSAEAPAVDTRAQFLQNLKDRQLI